MTQFSFFPLDRFIARDDHLRNAVAAIDGVILRAEVEQNDADLTAIAGIDGCRAVGQGDGVLERETAAGADLRFTAGRQLHGETGRHKLWHAGRERG
jgi:hypothetical protein